MAFPWMLALKVIPWGEVLEHAPKVLKGADSCWTDKRHATRLKPEMSLKTRKACRCNCKPWKPSTDNCKPT